MAEVETSGPVFHPELPVMVMLDGVAEDVANFVEALWLTNLNASIRVNRGVYVSNINVRREQDGYLVNDNGIVYGPWLESGVSNRVTRFPGYRSLGRALVEADGFVEDAIQKRVDRFVDEMNG